MFIFMHCLSFLHWAKLCRGSFRHSFFILGTKKVVSGRVRQVVVLHMEISFSGHNLGHPRQVVDLNRWLFEQV